MSSFVNVATRKGKQMCRKAKAFQPGDHSTLTLDPFGTHTSEAAAAFSCGILA